MLEHISQTSKGCYRDESLFTTTIQCLISAKGSL